MVYLLKVKERKSLAERSRLLLTTHVVVVTLLVLQTLSPVMWLLISVAEQG